VPEQEQLSQEGTFDSSGSFSLDVPAMLARLGKHALPSPEFYVLKLVQSAVAGGATYIHFHTHRSAHLEVTFDGLPWEEAELEQLHQYLGGAGDSQRHLHHLAVAMQACWMNLSPSHWELLSSRARLTHRGLQAGACEKHNAIRLNWSTGLFSWLTRRLFWTAGRLLYSRARYAPIAVFVNRAGLNRHAGAINMPFRSTGSQPPLNLEADVDVHNVTYFLPTDGPGDVLGSSMSLCQGITWWTGDLLQREGWQALPSRPRGVSYFGRPGIEVHAPNHELGGILYGNMPALGCAAVIQAWPLTAAWGSVLTLICDGVALNPERLSRLVVPPGYRMWVSARALGTDLSHFQVVHDGRYANLLQSLRQLVEASQARPGSGPERANRSG
jgi:hypothetical protein